MSQVGAREPDAPRPVARDESAARVSRGARASVAIKPRKSNAAMLGVVVGGIGMIALGGTATWWALLGSKAAARSENRDAVVQEPLAPSVQPPATQVTPVFVPVPSGVGVQAEPPQVDRDSVDMTTPAETDTGTPETPRIKKRKGTSSTSSSPPPPDPDPPPRRDPDPPPRRDPDPEPSISPDLRNPFSNKPKN
jgi:hypothetical protein